MGRAPCCEKVGLKKGPWSRDEDQILISYITLHGHGNWRALPKKAGLMRCGKSCRLRWINYLRPDIKRGNFTREEEDAIINLHQILGNRWSAIAARLPGRTDNEIKNVWHTHLKKRLNNKLQEEMNKETLSSSVIDNKSQPVTTDAHTASTCRHHVPLSPHPSSSITDDISSSRNIRSNDKFVIGTSSNNAITTCNNALLEIDEPFWSEVLSEGTKSSSIVAAPFQLSPISGFEMGEKGGFVGCGCDNVMEFWNEGFDRCEDYFAPNMF